MKDCQGVEWCEGLEPYLCPCCAALTWMGTPSDGRDVPSDAVYLICAECGWENDGMPEDWESEIAGPNSTTLKEARKNYVVFGACDAHWYEMKTGKELPEGVDDPTSPARLAWMIMTSCPDCGNRTGYGEPCSSCGG
jgi:hypothetical protein